MLDWLKKLYWECSPHFFSVLFLTTAAFAVYGPILGHEFLGNWDDNRYILENFDVQGISWLRIKAVFSRYYVGNYAPVQMLSYMLDYLLWGLWPGGYLLTNLLLHLAASVLLYRFFFQLTEERLAAWSGAALFLLHPVQVETVAWISQRKNLLAMLFFLGAWDCYRLYRDSISQRGRLYFAASVVALLLAVLSKSIAVIFPVVILIYDNCYPSLSARFKVLDKVPYLLVAVAAAALAVLSQTPNYTEWGAGGGRAGYHGGSAMATFLTMLPVFCSYIRLIVWPFNLSALYDPAIHKSIDAYVLAAALVLSVICFLLYRLYKYDRRIAFWPLLAIVALLPVSQIVPLVTLINDRYLYFPMIGVAALLAYGVKLAGVRWPGRLRPIIISLTILLFFLAGVSMQRIDVWRNGISLWKDTVGKSPKLALAWEGLGEALHYNAQPDYEGAKKAYLRAVELSPDSDITRYNLGLLYTSLNDFANADQVLRELLKRSPNNVMGWAAFGDLALRRSLFTEAETRFRKALSLQPEAVQVHQKIGNLMIVLGRFDEARHCYLRIEEIQGGNDPINAYELARLEALAGDAGGAIRWLETALQRGYGNFAGIMTDEELTPIRSDGRFGDLVTKYFPKP
ncbi:tetratricopeptide repeat protein [Geobacter pelophilus]|uniref:Tetratricopeptide repeat protein n=1 Tax=Geoanaerobacter pelophilus TaxID=60036 RepID=A0AAW4LBP3_9BACT|nr:tetratricopeptide repeat protein [Geoanaerobacter pelophilus]MBT0666518.1 tetratricopeptide repeat protein [Geoanaerobacter pelophilus]